MEVFCLGEAHQMTMNVNKNSFSNSLLFLTNI